MNVLIELAAIAISTLLMYGSVIAALKLFGVPTERWWPHKKIIAACSFVVVLILYAIHAQGQRTEYRNKARTKD